MASLRRTGQRAQYGPEIVCGVWLGTEDSNPDLLIQSQLSYH